jgi:hypothetical protein
MLRRSMLMTISQMAGLQQHSTGVHGVDQTTQRQ